MAKFTIRGKVHVVEPKTKEFKNSDGTRTYHKRYIVIDATRYDPDTGLKYFDNFPCFEFAGENCEKLDTFQVGQKVEITFDVRGRKWVNSETGAERWLNTLSAFKIELIENMQPQQQHGQQVQYQPQQVQTRPVQQRPQAPAQGVAPQYNQPPYQPPIPGGEIYANQVQDPPLPFQPQPTTRKPVQKQMQEENDLPF